MASMMTAELAAVTIIAPRIRVSAYGISVVCIDFGFRTFIIDILAEPVRYDTPRLPHISQRHALLK